MASYQDIIDAGWLMLKTHRSDSEDECDKYLAEIDSFALDDVENRAAVLVCMLLLKGQYVIHAADVSSINPLFFEIAAQIGADRQDVPDSEWLGIAGATVRFSRPMAN
jgi:hypothetical protein